MLTRRECIGGLAFGMIVGLPGVANARLRGRLRRRTSRGDSTSGRPQEDAEDNEETAGPLVDFEFPLEEKWKQLRIGMSENEVVALLGRPLQRRSDDARYMESIRRFSEETRKLFSDSWIYGYLRFNSPVMPGLFAFVVTMQQGEVIDFHNPFEGDFSLDGLPSVPRPIVPHNMATFSHFPRFLDLRWAISSGRYPLAYDVELQSAVAVDCMKPTERYHDLDATTTYLPHWTIKFPGRNCGRWRVRATNSVGQGPWSEYSYFRFDR